MVDISLPDSGTVLVADEPAPANNWSGDFLQWFAGRQAAHTFRTTPVPFAELDGWSFDPATGNLGHRSGGFFTVEGITVRTDYGQVSQWSQPIIVQNEVGILGLVMKRFGGVPHFLLQAKMEPGNINVLQLSPTVQATRSNYTRRHGGSRTRYLEYFVEPGRGRVIADVLQSEHGAWFLGKRNRNVVIEVTEDIDVHEDFRWMTLDQLHTALGWDNVVNMDTRTVLSCLSGRPGGDDLLPLLSWFTDCKSRYQRSVDRVPLAGLPGWRQDERSISHEAGRFFSVIGARVTAATREVAGWTQPLFRPTAQGLIALLTRQVGGGSQVLLRAHLEPGLLDLAELAPTVMCQPDDLRDVPAQRRPAFLDYVQNAPPSRIRFDTLLSEEGGRFFHAESRYVVVDVGDDVAEDLPPEFRWVDLPHVDQLLWHPHYLSVQARTLIACLPACRD